MFWFWFILITVATTALGVWEPRSTREPDYLRKWALRGLAVCVTFGVFAAYLALCNLVAGGPQ